MTPDNRFDTIDAPAPPRDESDHPLGERTTPSPLGPRARARRESETHAPLHAKNGGGKAWNDTEKWARQSSDTAARVSLANFREPRIIFGLITALILVASGIHMASSATPTSQKVAVPASQASTSVQGKVVGEQASAAPSAAKAEFASKGSSKASAEAQGKAASEQPVDSTLTVHVVGAVNAPGIVHLPAQSRAQNAVDAAGGLTSEADVRTVNLARKVEDGEQLYIPKAGETPPAAQSRPTADAGASAPSTAKAASSGKVNINTATATELEALPGIGPSLAERIVKHREHNGPFATVESIKEVSGIGEATYAKFADRLAV